MKPKGRVLENSVCWGLVLRLVGCGSPGFGGPPTSSKSTSVKTLTSSPNTLTETRRVMFDQVARHLVAQASWHRKLIITPNKVKNDIARV